MDGNNGATRRSRAGSRGKEHHECCGVEASDGLAIVELDGCVVCEV